MKFFGNIFLSTTFKKSTVLLLTSFSLIFSNLLQTNNPSELAERENVLIIHSYNQGFAWTDELHKGINDKLSPEQYNIFTEYLDAYRVTPTDPSKIETIKNYAEKNISYIIVTDNTAFELILSLKEEYFPDTPVLFAGVNGGLPENFSFDDVKGILQNVSYDEFLLWFDENMPQIKDLLICGANTSTTQGTYKQIMEAYDSLGGEKLHYKITFIGIDDYSEEMKEIKKYSADSTALYSAGSIGVLNHYQYTDMLATNSEMPTFCGVYTSISKYVVGGYVVSPYEHGQILGDEIISLSHGTTIDEIPIIDSPIQQIVFSYDGLKKFDIPETALPKNSIIINKPLDTFVLTLDQVIIIGAIVSLLIVLVSALLVISTVRRKANILLLKANKELYENKKELEINSEKLIESKKELVENYELLLESNQKITNLLDINQLTGIYKDTKFFSLMEEKYSDKGNVTILNITLTNLNKLTFTHGTDIYESILKSISSFLTRITGEEDLIGLSTNNDFLIAVKGTLTTESPLLQKLSLFFETPLITDLFTFIIKYKIGIAYYPAHTNSLKNILYYSRMAITPIIDNTLVNISVFDKTIMDTIEHENSIKNEIEMALIEREFILYYQPKYAIDGTSILGIEALIRWKHKDGSIKSPGYFIDIAEQSGQIINIGFYVIEEACRAIKEYDLAKKNIPIAINLSGHHFASRDIIYKLTEAIHKYGISPHLLELEITETTLITNKEYGASVLAELQELGFTITLDDFGTGYASINYIKDLPIDRLKIDQSFSRKLQDVKSQNLLKSMIQLAHELSYDVTVEGVETKEQFDIIKEFEPREFQGYLFKKPCPMNEIYHQDTNCH